jgi:MoCo/4Fe-4S cofactor protein with predicted Tat translocation signal
MSSITRDSHKTGIRQIGPVSQPKGKAYWRSLEALADTPEFRAYVESEFPEGATAMESGVERRAFLKMMGASLAFAGLAACTRQPVEKIVPHVRAPEDIIPGKPLYFASAHVHGGYATGVLVESHEGRPTKVEGNPEHPASLGATDVFAQASILSLYDPDRSHTVRRAGQISTWDRFIQDVTLQVERQRITNGAGFRILTETVTSPTLHEQIKDLLKTFPGARWHQYEPVNRDAARQGSQLAFSRYLDPIYDLSKADVILSLDSDFLSRGPAHLKYARAFARRRKPTDMNRLYVVEPSPTNTGAMADHRLPVRAGDIEIFAREIAYRVGTPVEGGDPLGHGDFINAVVEDLRKAGRSALVIPGESQSPAVHALAHAINDTLGATGSTVRLVEPVEADPVIQSDSIQNLVEDIGNNQVDLLLMIGGNPVHTVHPELGMTDVLEKVNTRIHVSATFDETSRLCHWHVPQTHDLESWSDARAYDGTVTIIQPLIEPLYGGRSVHEVMAAFLGDPGAKSYDIVKNYWQGRIGGSKVNFESKWQQSLHDGVVPDTRSPERSVKVQPPTLERPTRTTGLEVSVRPDPMIWDGRYANNGWLQELPKPSTRLTWENAALMAPETARTFGVVSGDVIRLTVREGAAPVELPVWEQPGQSPETVTVHLGYGRTHVGAVGEGLGVNVVGLSPPGVLTSRNVEIVATGAHRLPATTQDHGTMEGRELVRVGSLSEYEADPGFAHHGHHVPGDDLSMYEPDEHKKDGYQWGMAIDLNSCIGCSACTIACQSENNIPVVGKDQVANGREMHWIRIDRYYAGPIENPEIYNQPVPCMHCENAPCEVVCPVNATVHSDEGLNEMVYNRCVGTRYCSNNCPYKVRRFNFLEYTDQETESFKLMRNPDVTVRSRGVMEKCTFCVQRINSTRISAKKEDRDIRDGEVVTACEQVCPTEAIVFGDISDPESRVSRLKADERNYGLLAELNTKPRTTYLARIRNPNPALENESHGAPVESGHHG